jgi:hypothetical protein
MEKPQVQKSGVRISPKHGIERFGIFFFENQPAEVMIDNIRLVENLENRVGVNQKK